MDDGLLSSADHPLQGDTLSAASIPGSPSRVGVVGVGNVGATFAFSLVLSGTASEIVLVDANEERVEGEAMDLNHSVPFTRPTRIWAGTYEDLAGVAVTVISAGAGQRPGESRLDLIKRNAAIFRQVVPQVAEHNPDGVIVIATNPVDILTYEAWKISGLPPSRVFGSGTILDTARFRYLLSEHFRVDPRSVHAFIVGEHGDSEVPVWSLANIAGMQLRDYSAAIGLAYEQAAMDEIFAQTRDAAYRIIERKGATYYAVAAGLMRIVEAILRDQRTVLSVSSLISDYYGVDDVCLSLPTVISRRGVEGVLRLELDRTEAHGFRHSAEVLRSYLDELAASRPGVGPS
ncbi:MAG TPA: L-lactate dehydrogenase [Candidatus Limnocylindrales bacterium]